MCVHRRIENGKKEYNTVCLSIARIYCQLVTFAKQYPLLTDSVSLCNPRQCWRKRRDLHKQRPSLAGRWWRFTSPTLGSDKKVASHLVPTHFELLLSGSISATFFLGTEKYDDVVWTPYEKKRNKATDKGRSFAVSKSSEPQQKSLFASVPR